MDAKAVIEYVAQAEAKAHSPRRASEADAIAGVPYMEVVKGAASRYTVEMHGHKGHDNESRAPFMASVFRDHVLPGLDKDVDASGLYPMELHDSYSYLDVDGPEMRKKYRGALTFSKDMSHRHAVLMPDLYQLCGYSGLLDVKDTLDFASKKDAVLFAGTTTGSKNPLHNARILACRWAAARRPFYDFYITNVAQMTVDDIIRAYPTDADKIFHAPVSHQDHFQYKYVFNVQGNTCCWSRVPMIMHSQSLMINLEHPDGTWYYPLMRSGAEFVNVGSMDALPAAVAHCANNPAWCRELVKNANRFVADYCGQAQALHYLRSLVTCMAANK